jgi:stress response protein YsnF
MQPRTEGRGPHQGAETVISLAAEELAVAKQSVETGRVQVARVTHEREELIDELLAREKVEVSRNPIGWGSGRITTSCSAGSNGQGD